MKHLIGCWAVIFFLVSGSASAQVFYPESATLSNGLQVVVIPNDRAPVVTHMLWFKAGAIDEEWGKSGIAHFLEHLMFKGTPRYPEGEYSKAIAAMGGNENAFTSQDYTAFYATVGKDNLEKVMELESDRWKNWRVTDEQVARERDVVLKERQQVTENNPVAAFFEEVNAVLYPNYPYQRPVIGWRSEIEKLSRQYAEEFVRHHYVPSNAVLVLSGDVTLKTVLPMVKKYYGNLPDRRAPVRHFGDIVTLDTTRRVEKSSPLVREMIWSRHALAPSAREGLAASDDIRVLQKILGDSRVGRLYRRLVVQEKMATSASVSYSALSYGPARISLVVVPVPSVSLDKIRQIVDEEIALLLRNGVTDEEVRNAAQALEIEAAYARDSVSGPARSVGTALMVGLTLDDVEAWPKRMQAVSVTRVNEIAERLFAQKSGWVEAVLKPATEPKETKAP